MTTPRRRPIVDRLVAALLAAFATGMFLLVALLAPTGVPQPLLLAAAATTGVCAWRYAR